MWLKFRSLTLSTRSHVYEFELEGVYDVKWWLNTLLCLRNWCKTTTTSTFSGSEFSSLERGMLSIELDFVWSPRFYTIFALPYFLPRTLQHTALCRYRLYVRFCCSFSIPHAAVTIPFFVEPHSSNIHALNIYVCGTHIEYVCTFLHQVTSSAEYEQTWEYHFFMHNGII